MNKRSLCLTLGLTLIGLVTVPAVGQNLVLNPDFETAGPANWTLAGGTEYRSGGWFGGVDAHSPTHYVGTASNGGTKTCTATQSISLPSGPGYYDLSLSFWAELYDIGRNPDRVTGRIVVNDETVASVELNNQGTTTDLTPYTQKTINWSGAVNTLQVQIELHVDGSSGWGVAAADDVSLTAVFHPDPVIYAIDPTVIPNNSADTNVTITGVNLAGVTAAKLVQEATVLAGTNLVVAGDGMSLTCSFPTTGAAVGFYDVVCEKAGFLPSVLQNGFAILNANAASTLLLNGGFEDAPGNSQDWYGDYLRTSPSSSPVHVPADPYNPLEGNYYWYRGQGPDNTQLFTPGFWQVVSVPVNSPVFFEGFVHVGPGIYATNTVTVRLHDGDVTQTVIAEAVVDQSTPFHTGDWARVLLGGVCTTGRVAVEVTTLIQAASGHNDYHNETAAVFLDDFKLYTTNPCVAGHTQNPPSGYPTPVELPDDVDPTLTITGANLDSVTNVWLVQISGLGTFLPGSIISQTAGSLSATFAFPPEGAPTGLYSVITEQALANNNCIAQVVDDAYNVYCTSWLTAVEPNSLVKPQSTVQLTVTGQNVDRFDRVKLVYTPEPRDPPGDRAPYWVPVVERTGEVVTSSPNAVVMTFDLHNAQAGQYKLVGERDAGCPATTEVTDAFTLALPTGDSIVVDGGFEDASSAWVLTPDEGNTQKGDPMPGAAIAYTNWVGPGDPGNYGYPKISGIDPPTYPGDEVLFARGGNYLAGCYSFAYHSDDPDLDYATWVSPNNGKVSQSLGLPNGPGNYELVMTYWVRIWDQLWVGSSLKASIIVDGVEASSTTIAFPGYGKASQDGNDPYTQLSVDFIGAAMSDITVEFYFQTETVEADYADSAATTAIAIDDVAVFGALACGDPFADADKDGDVDQADFAMMQACYTGSGGDVSDECRCFDRKDSPGSLPDSDVDNTDMASFEACASGPGIAADPTCDDDN
jgi:hypothetical protein